MEPRALLASVEAGTALPAVEVAASRRYPLAVPLLPFPHCVLSSRKLSASSPTSIPSAITCPNSLLFLSKPTIPTCCWPSPLQYPPQAAIPF